MIERPISVHAYTQYVERRKQTASTSFNNKRNVEGCVNSLNVDEMVYEMNHI